MQNLDKILHKMPINLSFEEWVFLNTLDFDSLFKTSCIRDHRFRLESILFEIFVYNNNIFDVVYRLNLYTKDKILTDKGNSLVKWAIIKFNCIINIIDYKLNLNKLPFEIIKFIPIENYGTMLSLSKNPSKLALLLSKKQIQKD